MGELLALVVKCALKPEVITIYTSESTCFMKEVELDVKVNDIIEEIVLHFGPDYSFDEDDLCFHGLSPYYMPEMRTHAFRLCPCEVFR